MDAPKSKWITGKALLLVSSSSLYQLFFVPIVEVWASTEGTAMMSNTALFSIVLVIAVAVVATLFYMAGDILQWRWHHKSETSQYSMIGY